MASTLLNHYFSVANLRQPSLLLFMPIAIFALIRFFRQLPLEEFRNAKVNPTVEVSRESINKLSMKLIDFLAKTYMLLIFYFILLNFFSCFENEFEDFKARIFIGFCIILTASDLLLIIFALFSPYLTWFMLSRIASIIILINFPDNLCVFSINVMLGLLNEIGLNENIWKDNVSYILFAKASKMHYLTCLIKFVANYFFK